MTYVKTADGVRLRKLEAVPCLVGKSGDFRPYVTEDEKEREKTFRILSPNTRINRFDRAPESFRTTGTILFDEEGVRIGD